MLLAKRNQALDESIVKKIIGIALTIHWFGVDKAKAVDILVKSHNDLANVSISDFNPDKDHPTVRIPLSIQELKENGFQLGENSNENQLEKWTDFWKGVVNFDANGEKYHEDDSTKRAGKYGHFIEKLRNETELLVYAQRAYIEEVFEGYDPSNKLMWKGHNRPWDYDHILPSNNFDGRGSRLTLKYHEVCKAWQKSIGNMVAVDFSFNRATQDTVNAFEKYAENMDIAILSENLTAFTMTLEQTNDPVLTKRFVLAAKDRLIKIYEEWYEKLDIKNYL